MEVSGSTTKSGYISASGDFLVTQNTVGKFKNIPPVTQVMLNGPMQLQVLKNIAPREYLTKTYRMTVWLGRNVPTGLFSILDARCVGATQSFSSNACWAWIHDSNYPYINNGSDFTTEHEKIPRFEGSNVECVGSPDKVLFYAQPLNNERTTNTVEFVLVVKDASLIGRTFDFYLAYSDYVEGYELTSTITYIKSVGTSFALEKNIENVTPTATVVLQEENHFTYEFNRAMLTSIGGDISSGTVNRKYSSLVVYIGDPTLREGNGKSSIHEALCFRRSYTVQDNVVRQLPVQPEDRIMLMPVNLVDSGHEDSLQIFRDENLAGNSGNMVANPRYLAFGSVHDHTTSPATAYSAENMVQQCKAHFSYQENTMGAQSKYRNEKHWIHTRTSAVKRLYAGYYSAFAYWAVVPYGSTLLEGEYNKICYEHKLAGQINVEKFNYFDLAEIVEILDAVMVDGTLRVMLGVSGRCYYEYINVKINGRTTRFRTNGFGTGQMSFHMDTGLTTTTFDYELDFELDTFKIIGTGNTDRVISNHRMSNQEFCTAEVTTTPAEAPPCGVPHELGGNSNNGFIVTGDTGSRECKLSENACFFTLTPMSVLADDDLLVYEGNQLIYSYKMAHGQVPITLYSSSGTVRVNLKVYSTKKSYLLTCGTATISCDSGDMYVPKSSPFPIGLKFGGNSSTAIVLNFGSYTGDDTSMQMQVLDPKWNKQLFFTSHCMRDML